MPIHKAPESAVASPEFMVAQQAAYLTHKYRNMFNDQSKSGKTYAYPPHRPAPESAQEGEMRALEENVAKGGHGVPLSSASPPRRLPEGHADRTAAAAMLTLRRLPRVLQTT